MDHLPAKEAAAQLATGADAGANGQRLLLRGVEAEKTQLAGVGVVGEGHHQLAARTVGDLAGGDDALDLRGLALAGLAQADDAGLVLVAKRQVQRQVDVARQAQLAQGLLGGGQGLAALHGTILPLSNPSNFTPFLARASYSPQACALSPSAILISPYPPS